MVPETPEEEDDSWFFWHLEVQPPKMSQQVDSGESSANQTAEVTGPPVM